MTGNNSKVRPGQKSLVKNTKSETPVQPHQSHQINIDGGAVSRVGKYTASKTRINEDILNLLPELRQAEEIVISSIISPNDFSAKALISDVDNILDISDNLTNKLKNITDKAVKKYKMVDNLGEMLKTALFVSGAHVEVIVPRSRVNEVITTDSSFKELKTITDLESFKTDNVTLENLNLLNFDLNTKDSIQMKDIVTDCESTKELSLKELGLEYVGNPYSVAIPSVFDTIRDRVVTNSLFLDKEEIDSLATIDNKTLDAYSRLKRKDIAPVVRIDKVDEDIKDNSPFRLELDSSAVAPLYADKKSQHLGYFIIVDEMFRSITNVPTSDDLAKQFALANSNSVIKTTLNSATANMGKTKDKSPSIPGMIKVVNDLLLNSINTAVDKSIYKNNYEFELDNSLAKIMLQRSLQNKKTRLLFIPAEYVSYIAFNYRANGTGKSLLEDIALLASFKAMLMIAEVHAAIDTHIPKTTAVVNIDDADPEPMKTVEKAKEIILAGINKKFLWGETDMEKYADWINNAGINIIYNHKSFPNTTIEITKGNRETNYTVDTTMSDKVRELILKSLGLSPTVLDEASNVDFASVAIINNSLTRKLFSERQEIFNSKLSDKLRKLIKCDSELLKDVYSLVDEFKNEFKKMINANISDKADYIKEIDEGLKVQIAKDLVEMMKVKLPKADVEDTKQIRNNFNDYVSSITEMIDILKESSKADTVSSELGLDPDILYNNLKLSMIIEWCEDNNYLNEVIKYLDASKDNKKVLENIVKRIATKDESIIALSKEMKSNLDAAIEKVSKMNDDNEEENATPPENGDEALTDDGAGDTPPDNPEDTGDGAETGSEELPPLE